MTTERTLATRDAIRVTLLHGAGPMPTTEVYRKVEDTEPNYQRVYQGLCALQRAGQVQRAGRCGTSASSEVRWQLATSSGVFNQQFANLLAEFEEARRG